jgi:para-aminobenzoate synthetase/4-amino-4-deoxychorismate lyase
VTSREPSPRLHLAPASASGWFGGRSLVATHPIEVAAGVSLDVAAAALEAAFESTDECLTAVLAAYDGTCTLVRFAHVDVPPMPPTLCSAASGEAPLLRDAEWDVSGREYRAAVEVARERIAAGDVYVLNLTARLTGRLTTRGPADAFEQFLWHAPASMAAGLTGLPGATPWIASVSPERFLRVTRGEHGARIAEICPIKGTAPRGATPDADTQLADALQRDPKERAEHIMVVDLERNDLGTCCVPGTVHVDPLYDVVPTPYCHQLVSTVRGTLRSEATFADVLASAFPCGSVTGAPKRAAMRIISELEATPRGAYCGALLVAMPGELDSSVLIRTLAGAAEDPTRAVWGAGCGITHDSDPAAEYLEMLLKATPVTGDTPPPVALRETMRVAHGRAALLDRHLARLASGGAGPGTLARVRAQVAEQLASPKAQGAYARLGVTVTPDGEVAAGLTLAPSSLDVPGGPIIVPITVAEKPALPPHAAKPAARRYWDRAHREAKRQGAHQALLVTADGELIDGSTATVWLLHGHTLSTPPAPPAVAGVMRELVLDRAAAHGLSAVEARLTLAEYESADEVWLSNAVGGFVRARRG